MYIERMLMEKVLFCKKIDFHFFIFSNNYSHEQVNMMFLKKTYLVLIILAIMWQN